MVKKTKSSAKQNDSNVVRIRATSTPRSIDTDGPEPAASVVTVNAKAIKAVKVNKVKVPKAPGSRRKSPRVLRAIWEYVAGAWFELRQVRWPNRRATWGMTGAVILYSAFFVVLVLLLDAGFKYLFDLILKK